MAATPGELIRTTRLLAGLTQAQLADAAATSQSAISAYENDEREPAISTLTKLIEAMGATLQVDVQWPTGSLRARVLAAAPDIRRLVEKYGFSNARLFGSVARGEDTEDSDIDLMVSGDRNWKDLAGLQLALQDRLGAYVDVVPDNVMKPNVLATAIKDAVVI
jgi:predicted nucleotidyltransferase/DNA-binding XRE family transcriptional regulator